MIRNIDGFLKRSLHFTRGDDLDDVPECAGVYAWFVPFECDTVRSLSETLDGLVRGLEKASRLTDVEARLGATSVTMKTAVPEFEDTVREAVESEVTLSRSSLEQLGNVLLVLSYLAPPIYVGVAKGKKGLKGRLKSHLAGKPPDDGWFGSFRARASHAVGNPNYLKRCLVAYLPLDGTGLPKEVARLLEHLLIRTIRPTQSMRG